MFPDHNSIRFNQACTLSYRQVYCQQASDVIKLTYDYRRGEEVITNTIARMKQYFLGTKNVNMLDPVLSLVTHAMVSVIDKVAFLFSFASTHFVNSRAYRMEQMQVKHDIFRSKSLHLQDSCFPMMMTPFLGFSMETGK